MTGSTRVSSQSILNQYTVRGTVYSHAWQVCLFASRSCQTGILMPRLGSGAHSSHAAHFAMYHHTLPDGHQGPCHNTFHRTTEAQ